MEKLTGTGQRLRKIWAKYIQGVSKKCNTFDLEYLKDGLIKSIVLLVYYKILSYNSMKPNFSSL